MARLDWVEGTYFDSRIHWRSVESRRRVDGLVFDSNVWQLHRLSVIIRRIWGCVTSKEGPSPGNSVGGWSVLFPIGKFFNRIHLAPAHCRTGGQKQHYTSYREQHKTGGSQTPDEQWEADEEDGGGAHDRTADGTPISADGIGAWFHAGHIRVWNPEVYWQVCVCLSPSPSTSQGLTPVSLSLSFPRDRSFPGYLSRGTWLPPPVPRLTRKQGWARPRTTWSARVNQILRWYVIFFSSRGTNMNH